MNTQARNAKVKIYIDQQLKISNSLSENDFTCLENYENIAIILDNLIKSKAMGFRGIVATAIAGIYLDITYDPENNFYACNPRSIFEHGVFYAFVDNSIPCGKSDPLNVAKNTNILDNNWALGKRPASAANAVVDFLKVLNSNKYNTFTYQKIVSFFFFRLSQYAKEIQSFPIYTPNKENLNQNFAYNLSSFVISTPESGAIPQFVVSSILKYIYENSQIHVMGGNESVFGTNTTSKKPADVWIEKDNEILILYEVTVKKIDLKRLDDCIQSISHINNICNIQIYFICNIPKDVNELSNFENGVFHYKGFIFNFVDIRSWIQSSLSILSTYQLNRLLEDLTSFMLDRNRPLTTKAAWNKLFN